MIEIQKPELEALILERMQLGSFLTVEDALLQALKTSPCCPTGANRPHGSTGADLVAAMQASPCKEIALEAARSRLPVRDVAF